MGNTLNFIVAKSYKSRVRTCAAAGNMNPFMHLILQRIAPSYSFSQKAPAHLAHPNTFTTLEAGIRKALQPTFNQQSKTEGRRTTKPIPKNRLITNYEAIRRYLHEQAILQKAEVWGDIY